MSNAAKFLLMLETLKFPENEPKEAQSKLCRLEHNINALQKCIRQEPAAIIEQMASELQMPHLAEQTIVSATDRDATYVIYLQHALLLIVREHNFNSDAKEDLISTRHINCCIEAVQDLAEYALRGQLHAMFRQGGGVYAKDEATGRSINYALLQLSIAFYSRMLQIKSFHLSNAMESVLRDYIAAIYTLFLARHQKESNAPQDAALASQLQANLDAIWRDFSKMEYFRNLMMLKGIRELPPPLQKQLHQELLHRLASPDGFTTLVATLHTAQQSTQSVKPLPEVVAHIVAYRGHSPSFQLTLLRQIFKFLALCLQHKNAMADCMGAGLLTLRRLYDLSAANQNFVVEFLNASLLCLTQPADLLSGLILMEHAEFCDLVALLFHLFCTSTVECLPSALLVAYLPLLLQLYYHLPELSVGGEGTAVQKQQIGALVMRCLNNRAEPALDEIVQKLYTLKFDEHWLQLHPRVIIFPNTEHSQIIFKIASADYKQDFSISLALPELLILAEHHTLTYRVFMSLLKLMQTTTLEDDSATTTTNSPIDLLHTEEDLLGFLNAKYPAKVEVLLSLNALISHQPLKTQIAENAGDFTKVLRQLIEERIASTTDDDDANSSGSQTLLLMLTLTQEMLEHNSQQQLRLESFRDFVPALQQLQRQQQSNQLIQQRIASLIQLISDGNDLKSSATTHNANAFNVARSLIESSEPHLQVCGIQYLVDLLRRRDTFTLSNVHIIVALALTALHSRESYTFLNCVRLLVVLVQTLDVAAMAATTPVLELLADEYLNDRAEMDFRLIVGEAIMKVCKELGPLCYKYKDVLFNTFMQGARSPLNEYRMSAFANLSQLCGILSYQVRKFFQELLHLINCELTTGKYLPAKRAAVLVLSDLLSGIDNLMEFEDILLPIYRLLKTIEAAEDCDAKMRVHAANGLKTLGSKCHEMLFPTQQLQKDIQIFGIKDKTRVTTNTNILELN